MSLSGEAIDLFVPGQISHVVVKRESVVGGRTLCEEVHIYFSDDKPVVVIDREFGEAAE